MKELLLMTSAFYDEGNTLLCQNIDVLTDVTDKLVQSSNSVKFEAKSRSPEA